MNEETLKLVDRMNEKNPSVETESFDEHGLSKGQIIRKIREFELKCIALTQ